MRRYSGLEVESLPIDKLKEVQAFLPNRYKRDGGCSVGDRISVFYRFDPPLNLDEIQGLVKKLIGFGVEGMRFCDSE